MLKLLDKLTSRFAAPPLTRTRLVAAIAIAVIADGLQLLLGPLGWVFVDGLIDVVAMLLTIFILGFHPLLLPTFLVEFIPVVNMLPTWTGCVIAVIALRKRGPPAPPSVQTDAHTGQKPLPEKIARRTDSDI